MLPRAWVALVALALASSGAAPAATGWATHSITRHIGSLDASVSYQINDAPFPAFRNVRLTVRREGRAIIDREVKCPIGRNQAIWCEPQALTLPQLDTSSAPDVVLDLFTGGAHCCSVSVLVLTGQNPPRVITHEWGDPGYKLQRYHGREYFVTGDDRFAYAFNSFAGSWFPSQTWAIDSSGQLANVTRTRPDLVARDAQNAWYFVKRGDGLGIVAGWCADEYTLGLGRRCEAYLTEQLRHGTLRTCKGCGTSEWPDGKGFIALLHKRLLAWGYER